MNCGVIENSGLRKSFWLLSVTALKDKLISYDQCFRLIINVLYQIITPLSKALAAGICNTFLMRDN